MVMDDNNFCFSYLIIHKPASSSFCCLKTKSWVLKPMTTVTLALCPCNKSCGRALISLTVLEVHSFLRWEIILVAFKEAMEGPFKKKRKRKEGTNFPLWSNNFRLRSNLPYLGFRKFWAFSDASVMPIILIFVSLGVSLAFDPP